jgi:predicted dienelactone hydrolase
MNSLGALQRSPDFDLAFRLHQPVPSAPKACVILLHGVGGSETNLAGLAAALAPDTLAVNAIFIGASKQLGEFESGATAALFGPVSSVVMGGVGTMLIAASWFRLFPALARRDRLG